MKVVVFVALALLVGLCAGGKIKSLPGYKGPQLNMWAGYVEVNKEYGANMFYWFVESQRNKSNDPLVIWLQGGPGCSGLGGGLFTENGPFYPDKQGGLTYTSVSWTNLANVLYLESPVGVGFSYATDTSYYNNLNDYNTAHDNLQLVKGFLDEFPQYKDRDIWITGESYGGVYIPTLAELMIQDPELKNRLTGIMLGNPVFDCETVTDSYYQIQFNLLYWHGLVAYHNYDEWNRKGCADPKTAVQECGNIFDRAVNEIGVIVQELKSTKDLKSNRKHYSRRSIPSHEASKNFPSLDPDDLYQDFCTDNGTLSFSLSLPGECDPTGDRTTAYLNTASVQSAIHAKVGTKWTECSFTINYTSTVGSLIPYYQLFFQQKPDLHILVYSGDVDIMTVPFALTQSCLHELKRPLTVPWQPWFVNGNTAGYVEVHDKFTYATLKGAGHEAPAFQPWTAYHLFERFVFHQNLTYGQQPPIPLHGSRRTQGDILRSLGLY